MDKYITENNEVAVITALGGWSTLFPEYQDALLFDDQIVRMVLQNLPLANISRYVECRYSISGNEINTAISNLQLNFIPVGTNFFIYYDSKTARELIVNVNIENLFTA